MPCKSGWYLHSVNKNIYLDQTRQVLKASVSWVTVLLNLLNEVSETRLVYVRQGFYDLGTTRSRWPDITATSSTPPSPWPHPPQLETRWSITNCPPNIWRFYRLLCPFENTLCVLAHLSYCVVWGVLQRRVEDMRKKWQNRLKYSCEAQHCASLCLCMFDFKALWELRSLGKARMWRLTKPLGLPFCPGSEKLRGQDFKCWPFLVFSFSSVEGFWAEGEDGKEQWGMRVKKWRNERWWQPTGWTEWGGRGGWKCDGFLFVCFHKHSCIGTKPYPLSYNHCKQGKYLSLYLHPSFSIPLSIHIRYSGCVFISGEGHSPLTTNYTDIPFHTRKQTYTVHMHAYTHPKNHWDLFFFTASIF